MAFSSSERRLVPLEPNPAAGRPFTSEYITELTDYSTLEAPWGRRAGLLPLARRHVADLPTLTAPDQLSLEWIVAIGENGHAIVSWSDSISRPIKPPDSRPRPVGEHANVLLEPRLGGATTLLRGGIDTFTIQNVRSRTLTDSTDGIEFWGLMPLQCGAVGRRGGGLALTGPTPDSRTRTAPNSRASGPQSSPATSASPSPALRRPPSRRRDRLGRTPRKAWRPRRRSCPIN